MFSPLEIKKDFVMEPEMARTPKSMKKKYDNIFPVSVFNVSLSK